MSSDAVRDPANDALAGGSRTEIDPAALGEPEQYKLMTGTVIPRPIALVTTVGTHGNNAAPFSLFNMAGTSPPMVMFSVGDQSSGAEKDTIQYLRRVPEFVVHIVSEAMAEQMNECATNYPIDVDEIAAAGFTPVPSVKVRPPRIKESPAQMECSVLKIIDVGARHHVVLGQVVWFHYHPGIVDERFHVALERLNPIGRLSGSRYARIRDLFEMHRRVLE